WEARREVWFFGSGQSDAVLNLLSRIRPLRDLSRIAHVTAHKHQSSGGELRHLDRVVRDVEGIADYRLPLRRGLRLEGVPEDAVPVLQRRIYGQNRDALARVIVGKGMIDLAHSVRFAGEGRAGKLHHG